MARRPKAEYVLSVIILIAHSNVSLAFPFSTSSPTPESATKPWQPTPVSPSLEPAPFPPSVAFYPPTSAPPLPSLLPPLSPSPAPALHLNGIKGAYWPRFLAESFPPSSIPTSYFTHLFYAYALLDPTTYQLSITQYDDIWMGNFTSTLHLKSPKAKAFLSIGGGYTDPTTFSNMVSDHAGRAAFINSTISIARKYNFDGLDLDWEFPRNPHDMSNLALLFKEWRSSVNNEAILSNAHPLQLSAAVYFAPSFFSTNPQLTYPGDAIKENLDFLSPMCFDYHGGWDSSFTGAPALLYDKSSNISTSYGISSWIRNGVPPEKLVMGIPMFGRSWQLKDPDEHGIGAPAVGIGPGFNGGMNYSAIVDFNQANGGIEVYDNETVSTYSYAGIYWIGYDNVTSIVNKIKFAKEQGLGGYFFWAIGEDRNWILSNAASTAWDEK